MAQTVKNLPAVQETQVQSLGQEDPQRKEWRLTPIFVPREPHGQTSLAGYSPWGHKESDWATNTFTFTQYNSWHTGASTEWTGKKSYWLEEGEEVEDGRADKLSAIGDGGRTAVSFMLDGTGLEKMICWYLGSSSFFLSIHDMVALDCILNTCVLFYVEVRRLKNYPQIKSPCHFLCQESLVLQLLLLPLVSLCPSSEHVHIFESLQLEGSYVGDLQRGEKATTKDTAHGREREKSTTTSNLLPQSSRSFYWPNGSYIKPEAKELEKCVPWNSR